MFFELRSALHKGKRGRLSFRPLVSGYDTFTTYVLAAFSDCGSHYQFRGQERAILSSIDTRIAVPFVSG